MKHPLRIAAAGVVALAACVGAACAQLAGGEMADLNQDGNITRQEVGQATLMRFEQLDTDADGYLSPEELNAEALRRFDSADANNDGVLTRSEMRAMAKARFRQLRR